MSLLTWGVPKGKTLRKTQQPVDSETASLKHSDRLILAFLFLFLAAEVFAGPMRYFYVTMIDAAWLAYVPKFLIMTAFIGMALKATYTLRIDRSILRTFVLFAIFLVIGAYYIQNWIQPLFGLFVFLPLMFAVLAEPSFSRFGERLVPYAVVLWLCAAAGVLYDYQAEIPWAGMVYDMADMEVEGSRSWTTFGVERVAGFSRASFAVAWQMLFLALPCVILGRQKSLALIVWIVTGILIVLTTTKKTVGVYLFFTLLLPLLSTGLASRKFKKLVAVTGPILVVLIGIALPLSTLFIDYRLSLDSHVSQFLFTSFEDRLTTTWPNGFALVFDHGNILLGRGIGGIGIAQKYFDVLPYSVADNLYLYLYATFGVVALFLIWIYTANICRLNLYEEKWARLMWFLAIAALMGGWATNGIEGPFTSSMLGLTLAYAFRHRSVTKRLRLLTTTLIA